MKYNFKNDKTSKVLILSSLSVTLLLNSCSKSINDTTNSTIEVIESNNISEEIVEDNTQSTISSSESVITNETNISEESTDVFEENLSTFNNKTVYVESRINDFELSDYVKSAFSEYAYNYIRPGVHDCGYGLDSERYRTFLTDYYVDNYATTEYILTIDDFNYFNIDSAYNYPIDIDSIKQKIELSKCNYNDGYKIIRATLLSLGLTPYISEVPDQYMSSVYQSIYNMEDMQFIDFYMTMANQNNNELYNNTDDYEISFCNLFTYNSCLHANWLNNVPLARFENGSLGLNLHPSNPTYKLIIQAFEELGMPLNTEIQIDPETGEELTVIIPDTPEFFEEIYGESYTDVLERAGLPLNPEHDNFFPDPNSYGFMVDANENVVDKNTSYSRTR